MGRSGLVSLPLARLEKTFKMVVKISLIASFAAVLIICATAELPTEENNVLDSEVGLDSINPVVGLEENTAEEEDLRQKREAIPDQKKGKGKGNGKARNGKGKGKTRKGKGKKPRNGKGKGKGKTRKGKGKKPRNGKEKGKGKKARKGKGKGKDRNIKNGKNSKNGNRKNTIKEKNEKGKGKNGGRNGKKSKKGRKNKKQKTNGRRNKPKKIGGQSRQTTINLTCLRDAVTYTKFLKDNVVNFLRRNTRLAKQNKLTNNKAGKKGEFKEPAARLIQAGGGDKTNLSC